MVGCTKGSPVKWQFVDKLSTASFQEAAEIQQFWMRMKWA
jgi:hypothetical protein